MVLELLLAVAVIVVIILIFYALVIQPRRRRARAKKLLEISSGTFDEPAQKALEDLDAQGELTPEQHAIRGNIIRYNLLENPRTIPRGTAERQQFGRMVRDYEQAVRGVGDQMRINIHDDRNDRNARRIDGRGGERVGGRDGEGNHARANWRIFGGTLHDHPDDNIEAANIIRGAMTLNDFFGPVAMDPIEQDFDILQMMMMLNTAVIENGPVIQQGLIEQRVQAAVATAPNRAAAVEAALAPKFTDDRQNVHDTKINSDLNEILKKIAAPVSSDTEIASARSYIRANRNGIVRQRAEEALSVMAQGGHMSTYGDNEAHIFALVWKRCSDPRNAASADTMREAVVDALADCYDGEPKHLVCANGRCSRVINSLALVDYDPSINGAMTFEAYKNLIMREANEIFENALAEAEDGEESERLVARSYTDPSVTPDPDAEREFKNKLRDSVDRMLDNYRDKFNARELEQLRVETYTYVTL